MFVKGKDLVFYIEIAGQNKPICHGRTVVLNISAGTLPSTTYGSGSGETNEYSGKYAYTIQGGGLTYIGDEADIFTLQTALMQFNKVNWTFTDDLNIQWYGTVLVTNVGFDSGFDALLTFSNELLGDGEYTFIKSDTPPTPPITDYVTILDQLGTLIAQVPAPGTYSVLRFNAIDCGGANQPEPLIIITDTGAV